MKTRYAPVEHGYQIVGGMETFNRVLHGGHGQDHHPEKFFTAAGDVPLVMGAITDWRKRADCSHAKCGTLMTGIAVTPGYHLPMFYYHGEKGGDRTAEWFHQSPGTVSTFCAGWMEYEVNPFFQCYPVVNARLEVLPLQSSDGFLVHLTVHTNQRELLAVAFGGVTDFVGDLIYPHTEARAFRPEDCAGNEVTITGPRCAEVRSAPGTSIPSVMCIGASFPVEVSVGDARRIRRPGLFLGPGEQPNAAPMVRMASVIEAESTLDGFIVVMRGASGAELESWLARTDPVAELRAELERKAGALRVRTPDRMLDLTVAPNTLAMDACWHGDAFCHGSYSWHCPYMGWRNWYGPTVMGWHERVQKAFLTHASHQVGPPKDGRPERAVFTGKSYNHTLENSYGYIPEIPDGRADMFYTMQEVGVDMALHNIEWTGDLEYARKVFSPISEVLAWEARVLDPDGDGLYQNWLNTWISDAHSYNGGGCAQSSAYNYRANRLMGRIAGLIGRDPAPFLARARAIREACQSSLWLPELGILAEYVDTIGNRLVHPSPELATAYHSIEMDLVDEFQSYQLLRFTETEIRNVRTMARGGRLAWSSNWLPHLYSSCGLYPAENIHLAWAYFRTGQAERANDILRAVTDAHFIGRYPGLVAHCMTETGLSEGSADFAEISSMYLRTLVEGLFGVRFNLLEGRIEVSPCLPAEWDRAELSAESFSLRWERAGRRDTVSFITGIRARKVVRLRLRSSGIEEAAVNGRPVPIRIEPGIGFASCLFESEAAETTVSLVHADPPTPGLDYPRRAVVGQSISIRVRDGTLVEVKDPSACLRPAAWDGSHVEGTAAGGAGNRTVFLRVKAREWDGWLPADLRFEAAPARLPAPSLRPGSSFVPVDISSRFNTSLAEIHRQEYWKPRPSGYSLGCLLNGRFGWDWNQKGFAEVHVDDSALRQSGGVYRVPSGVPFLSASSGRNVACASVWENYPDELRFPLEGSAGELAVFLVGVTNPMQSRVENGRLTVRYADGGTDTRSLVNPVSFDDWLVAAVQREHETVYFSDGNHGMVVRMSLDPRRALERLEVTAVANEVILGVLGISLAR